MKELFKKQKEYLAEFFDKIDVDQAEKFAKVCLSVKGMIVLTGVGKSGIIAEKIAMTLASTGTRAIHLSPMNFLHGDLGILSPDDLVIFLSKSGETEELLTLVPFIRRKGARFAALVANSESRLAKCADYFVHLPVQKELCPFDLAPTTSTVVQLLFGDALAIYLMQEKSMGLCEYGLNHPAGAIGKKISVAVDQLMLKEGNMPLVEEDRKIDDILSDLTEKKCGCLVVVGKQGDLQGIFTDGDLRRALQMYGSEILQKPVGAMMTKTAVAIPKDFLAWDALKIMQKDPKRWISVLPVLSGEQVVGVLRMHDIIQAGIS